MDYDLDGRVAPRDGRAASCAGVGGEALTVEGGLLAR